jgi:hypothetical protein
MAVGLILLCVCSAIIVVIILKRNIFGSSSDVDIVPVRSTVDDRVYYVQDKPDKQSAANLLAQVRAKMVALVECVKASSGKVEGLPDDQAQYGSYQSRVDRLSQRFNPDKIAEGNEDVKYTTYTIDKTRMVFCLRARDEQDSVHDLEMMTFVAIHEMAHITTITEHHTPEFNSNFKWLLKNAVKCGIYRPENFKASPRNYCGLRVSESPIA